MDRNQKKDFVEGLRSTLSSAELLVIAHQTGLNAKETKALRDKMRSSGASFKIAKNRLVRLALKDGKFSDVDSFLKGPTTIAYSSDPIAAAKAAVEFAKTSDKFKVVGASLNGKLLDKASVEALASLPSLDQLRGKLIGLIQAPATKVAGVLQAPAGQLARVFAAYGSKGEAA